MDQVVATGLLRIDVVSAGEATRNMGRFQEIHKQQEVQKTHIYELCKEYCEAYEHEIVHSVYCDRTYKAEKALADFFGYEST
jgi:hypothetical protein